MQTKEHPMYPHLPDTKPRAVIVNRKVNKDIINFFANHNIDVILSQKASSVTTSVAYHPDIQIAHIDDNVYVCAPEFYDYYSSSLWVYDVTVLKGERDVLCNYPGDIAYNVLRVGETSFIKSSHTDEVCLFHLKNLGVNIVDVSQGYSKCNGCVVTENSLITSDISIYKKCIEQNIDALLISQGGILLSGFDYGFIGGATFKYDKDTLCFMGDLTNHPDYDKIISFLSKKNIRPLFLSDKQIEDFGSVIHIY